MLLQKKFFQLLVVGFAALTLTACTKDEDEDEDLIDPPTNSVLTGSLTESRTLTADKKWTLKGYVYVPNGVTLTIEPGTTVVSDVTEKGALCIERGGKIIANGTADKPIVFTSGKAEGSRAPGDWGGVVILGRATTNRTSTPVIEGGLDRPYGGNDDNDNSGSLKYVRIEYAGVAAFANSEINGLTLGGVGSGTTLENIQIVYGNDDAYEFFGGTVNAKYLVAYATADDDFDFDFGYRGKIQFGVAMRDPQFVDNGDAGNGVEADNDGTGSTAAPFTKPVLSNFTWIGPNNASGTLANHNFGNRWRRAAQFVVRNSVLLGWQKAGLSIESDATAQAYKDGAAEFKNNVVHSNAAADIFKSNSSVMTAAAMETKALAEGNVKLTSPDGVLTAPFSLTSPNLAPVAGGAAAAGADFAGLDAFFTPTAYKGAVGATNWLQGWTRFPAKGQ
ncbi:MULTISPECIES: T9SS C-terminal target domain-containing protein [Chitinophagaceae]|uniref:T9SS C-terminal target domain-containing protein n=1 Tax=Chitinophagaceae TaxID=563835 RepID=UPI000DEFC10C|nr:MULTISPECIES: T9SS C-terminal target domain-containing protein [Chitinophagaceae]RPD48203.1 T9SS C-terminal target domain-containing protein [Paracnuella aquatica]